MQYENVKGRTMLKVVSIILIVFGALSLIGSAFTWIGNSVIGEEYLDQVLKTMGYTKQMWMLSLVITLISTIIHIIAGIIGIKFCRNRKNANLCVGLGVTLLILFVLSIAWSIISTPDVFTQNLIFNVISNAVSALLPVLYLVGAVTLKKSSQGNV